MQRNDRRESVRAQCESLERRRMLAVNPGTGLVAAYFPNSDFTGAPAVRIDHKVYFDPAALPTGLAPTTYSIRWTGKIKPAYSETYTFTTHADDGIRLWIDHKLIIDDWNIHPPAEQSETIALSASRKVDIQVEYFNHKGGAAAQLWWESRSQIKSVVPTSRLYPEAQDTADKIDHAFAFAQSQMARTLAAINNNPDAYVINTRSDGTWETTDGTSWTAGFLAGELWQLYRRNGRRALRLNATAWTRSLGDQTRLPSDMGFRIAVPYGPMYAASGLEIDRAVLVASADTKMAQFDETVGMFRSPGGTTLPSDSRGDFAVLLDHAMDMPLLYTVARLNSDASYAQRATEHLLKLAQYYVRADGSTAQWGYFDSSSGDFVGHTAKQGYSAQSTWSRGQAWAMHAYAASYAATNDPALLAIARKVADYWIGHVPADGVPYWDFDAPVTATTYRDSSAAAIAASALVQLSQIDPDATRRPVYRAAAEKIINSLLSPSYFAEGTANSGVLLHGAAFVPRKNPLPDSALIYGDYYFLEALNRYANS
jgi:hypothetical protein